MSALEAALKSYLEDLTIPELEAVKAKHWDRSWEYDPDALNSAYTKLKGALERDSGHSTYDEVRPWLTPMQNLNAWKAAKCEGCGRNLAEYKPNPLDLLPHISEKECRNV